jgi:hypothetical protein
MVRQPDLAHHRASDPDPVSAQDTIADVISGIVVMLFVIAAGFWIGGLFG